MIRVLVLGASGMLGHMVCKHLSTGMNTGEYWVEGTYTGGMPDVYADKLVPFMYPGDSVDSLFNGKTFHYVINCLGVIKPMIDESNKASVLNAIRVNSEFPHVLSIAAHWHGAKVIQIATDCVFNGIDDRHRRAGDAHDALDIYGRTKSLGEVMGQEHFKNIRCSIIGPELSGRSRSLWEWVRSRSEGETVDGYSSHTWNGVTTLAFAKVCHGIMSNKDAFRDLPEMSHLTVESYVSKYSLIKSIASALGRFDINVNHKWDTDTVARVLSPTKNNEKLWNDAGYATVPRIEDLITEMVMSESIK